jgi:solute carrier family 39 (zinc transporter), member 7
VQKLSALKNALDEQESPIMRKVFAWLFPFGPAWNSIIGTFYISSSVHSSLRALSQLIGRPSVPNFILAFIPAEINPDTLNTMTAFAVSRRYFLPFRWIHGILYRQAVYYPTSFCT